MKSIRDINGIIYGLTLIGYLTIIYGLYMQILLGFTQILFFLILLFNYDKFSKKVKDHLSIYGTTVIVYFVFILFIKNSDYVPSKYSTELGILISIFIPMTIATYFTYILYKLQKQVL